MQQQNSLQVSLSLMDMGDDDDDNDCWVFLLLFSKFQQRLDGVVLISSVEHAADEW